MSKSARLTLTLPGTIRVKPEISYRLSFSDCRRLVMAFLPKTFNKQQINGLCKSLIDNAVNF
jgi:hypothetical protein